MSSLPNRPLRFRGMVQEMNDLRLAKKAEAERHPRLKGHNDFEPSSHTNRLPLKSAILRARQIQGRHPRRLLCGSLALILYDVVSKKYVNDLDFCIAIMDHNHAKYNSDSSYTDDQGKIVWMHYNKKFPYPHCLFVHNYDVQRNSEIIDGIRCQNLINVIKWKKIFNREKDVTELAHLPESLFDF